MLSIVVPLYNEKESLHEFYNVFLQSVKDVKDYEIIFIDDGSIDNSLDILKEIAKKDVKVKIFSFRKNRGKAEALTYGFQKAKGDIIITLDADLQDKPEEIKKLINKIQEGWDVVCGWRKNRKDSFRKILSSRLFNFLTNYFWGLRLHDYNCGLKAYTSEAAKSLYLYGGMHRFIPALAYQEGFRVTEIAVEHDTRKFGISKYGFSKMWKDLPDMFTLLFLTRYSHRPLHFFGTVGGILFFIGIIILLYLSIIHFQGQAIGRRPLLFLGMLLVLSGFQVLFTGFLADLMLNISNKNSNKEEKMQRLVKYVSD